MSKRKIIIRGLVLFILSSLVITCIFLAFWQIDRGKQKDELYNSFKKSMASKPKLISVLPDSYQNFQKIQINGVYSSDKQFLLDNKVYKRKAGYDVLTPMIVNDRVILVNRGWVDNNNRLALPKIDISEPYASVIGYVYNYEKGYVLDSDEINNEWPVLIQQVDIKKMTKSLGREIMPYILVMSTKQRHSFEIRELYKKNDKLKHYMYSGQWFIFSIIGIYLIYILTRRQKYE